MNMEPKIHKQVTFYLSDSNLPFDKFLWGQHKKNNGWIPIKTIANFKKMQYYTKDLDKVVEALQTPSDLFEIDDDKKNVRRKTEVVQQFDTVSRTIYAKGFPLVDKDDTNSDKLFELQDKIEGFFAELGDVQCVRMRKADEKPHKFKGSVYVEFATKEEADKVAAMELEFEGTKLDIKTKQIYMDIKTEEKKNEPKNFSKKFKFNAFKDPAFDHRGGSKRHQPSHYKKSKTDAGATTSAVNNAEAETQSKPEAEKQAEATTGEKRKAEDEE